MILKQKPQFFFGFPLFLAPLMREIVVLLKQNNDFGAKTQFFFDFSLILASLMREIHVLLKQNNDFGAKNYLFFDFSLVLHSPSLKNYFFIT